MKVKFLIVLPLILTVGILLGHLMQVLANPGTPNPGHSVSSIGAGTFAETGDYVFPVNSRIGIGTNPSYALDINGWLRIQGSDFMLGTNDGRSIGTKTLQRALVHDVNDVLVINFDGDFEGGTRIDGNLNVAGKVIEYGNNLLPRGVIVMWSGTLATIPNGWALCNGGTYTAPDGASVTTPDLSNKFIYGTSAGENPGGTGGSTTHTHTALSWGMLPSSPVGLGVTGNHIKDNAGNLQNMGYTNSQTETKWPEAHTVASSSNIPPYYKLAFIMKL